MNILFLPKKIDRIIFLFYLLEKEGANRVLEETLEEMKGSQYYKSTENNLNIYLLDEQSEYYLPTSNNTYLQMSLILLVYENSLLINYILDNKHVIGLADLDVEN